MEDFPLFNELKDKPTWFMFDELIATIAEVGLESEKLLGKDAFLFGEIANDVIDLNGAILEMAEAYETSMVSLLNLQGLFKEVYWLQVLFLGGNYALVKSRLRFLWELMFHGYLMDLETNRNVLSVNHEDDLEAKMTRFEKSSGSRGWKAIWRTLIAIQGTEDELIASIQPLWHDLNSTVHPTLRLIREHCRESFTFVCHRFDQELAGEVIRVARSVFDVIFLSILDTFPEAKGHDAVRKLCERYPICEELALGPSMDYPSHVAEFNKRHQSRTEFCTRKDTVEMEKIVCGDEPPKGSGNRLRHRLGWVEVKRQTPKLFLNDDDGRPPRAAKKMWSVVNSWDLNVYSNKLEFLDARWRLVEIGMIFQELLAVGELRKEMVHPSELALNVGIGPVEVLKLFEMGPVLPSGNYKEDVVLLSDLNRSTVGQAMLHELGGAENCVRELLNLSIWDIQPIESLVRIRALNSLDELENVHVEKLPLEFDTSDHRFQSMTKFAESEFERTVDY